LQPDKSFIYPISFLFTPTREYIYNKVDSLDIEFLVKDENEYREVLRLIDTEIGMKTLGVYMAPNGNQSDENKALERKIVAWYNKMKAKKMLIEESWLCMNTTIMKTIE